MKKWSLIIDIEKCEDCNNCFLACKDEHVDNDWPGYTDSQPKHGHRWINIMRKERGQFPLVDVAYRPTPCMHCDDAPCIAAAKAQEIYKRNDGIVLIDPEKAKGQKELVKSCPYGAIWWNKKTDSPQKCTLCAHLLDDGWHQPRCIQACPTGAMEIVKTNDSDMQIQVAQQDLKILSPEYKTHPRVYYKNLYRFESCMITGSVSLKVGNQIDCATGACVALNKRNSVIAKTLTNNYGDYKFDHIEADSGIYMLHFSYKNFMPQKTQVVITKSISLGDILFE